MLKLSENPPFTFPENSSICDFQGKWWVAHTKARNEKALAWDMMRREISYFLPMTKKVTKTKGRVFRSLIPLFSSYVFFCGDEDSRLEVLKTNRTANIINVLDVENFVRQLASIQKAIVAGLPLEPYNLIKKGQKCRVIAGPLIGSEGIVVQLGNNTKLILQVEMLGQSASLEIQADLLEVVD